ncbi:hypothetical protein ACA910_017552 [Epithemia clementina (nom. ined.)]
MSSLSSSDSTVSSNTEMECASSSNNTKTTATSSSSEMKKQDGSQQQQQSQQSQHHHHHHHHQNNNNNYSAESTSNNNHNLIESREDVLHRGIHEERDDIDTHELSPSPKKKAIASLTSSSSSSSQAAAAQRKLKKPDSQQQHQHQHAAQHAAQHQQQQHSHPGRFYPSRQPHHGHFAMGTGGMPQGGGPYGPPYPYAGGNGHYPPHPPHYHPPPPPHPHHSHHSHHSHHYHPSQMPPMPHFNSGGGAGPYSQAAHAAAMGAGRAGGGSGASGNGSSTGGNGGAATGSSNTGPYSAHYGAHPYASASNNNNNMAAAAASSSYPLPPSYPNNNNMTTCDSASMSSSKGSRSSKKRTIDGVHEPPPPIAPTSAQHVYTFRRTDSNSSTTSTVTAGNNTSIETHGTEDTAVTHHHHNNSHNNNNNNSHNNSHNNNHHTDALGPASGYDDHDSSHHNEGRPMRTRYHRRDYSADASTTSSLSAGFSLESYDGPRDPMTADAPIRKSSPKRLKGVDGAPLLVDTNMRPSSVDSHDADQSTRFEQLSIGVKAEPETTKSDSSDESRHQNLFLSLSTSPINAAAGDIDATPISKNTTKKAQQEIIKAKASSIFKKKGGTNHGLQTLEVSTSDMAATVNSPTPPVHGELGDSDMMTDDHSTLNRHLRGQSFTPVNHLSSNSTDQGERHGDGPFSLAPQLSWSIAGDTPSLGELAEWEEEGHKPKHIAAAADQKIKPSFTQDSQDESRNMSISPQDFHLWKEEHELVDHSIGGATTPLPAFFESRGNEISENQQMNYEPRMKKHPGDDARPTFITSTNRHAAHNHGPGGGGGGRPMPSQWSKHDHMAVGCHTMPPTPMYPSTEYRDDCYPIVRSPYGADRRDQIDAAGAFPFFPHPGDMHSNGRVRNLRGRMPANAHFPPMLHIPPPMSAQLPMTSPMALPGKAGLWSPHGGLPPMNSPHHLTSPMNSMSQTKRKCVPLKPPIPSKFQGDPDKVKNIPVPEFTSLVNFPSHMSQKQAVNLPEGMRCCVMCGNACPSSNGGKNKKKKTGEAGGLAQRSSNSQDLIGEKAGGYAQIPTQNKGLCTLCDVNVWVVVASGLEIKWCKGCKNFRPWAAFGDKGLATKCLRCRERQREKYALQKEEKEKARSQTAVKSSAS